MDRIPVPLSMKCVRCGKGFQPSDQGFEMPYADFPAKKVKAVYYHKGCLLREIGVMRDAPSDTPPTPAEVPLPTTPSTAEAAKAMRGEIDRIIEGGAKAIKGK